MRIPRPVAVAVLSLAAACGGGGDSPGGGGGGNGPPMPPQFLSLAPGFTAESVLQNLATPVKLALAPDGRLFFNELDTGDTRVVDASGSLLATPFSHVDVVHGGHNGLLGLALAPDFATSGHVYMMACVPAATPKPDRVQIIRFTDVQDVGTNETVIVDDLPEGILDNGGDIVFGLDGNLFVSLGDVSFAPNAQDDASLAGRILRYTPDGGIPADNPNPASPEWCRGLRNTFSLAVHPTTGGLFGGDNGPANDDHLNYLQAGKNFGWPTLPAGIGQSQVGFSIRTWVDVIVPTALTWHDGTGWGSEYANDLFLTSYADESIRRIELSGAAYTDLDAETVFAHLVPTGTDNKPLDILMEPDGSLLFSTFTAIWRIRKTP